MDEIDIHAEPTGEILLLPGKRFPFNFSSGFEVGGRTVVVHERPNTGLGTGLTVWDGAVVLAKYLEHALTGTVAGAGAGQLRGAKVVEVGAGTGLVGLAAAALGAREVWLTDLGYCLGNLHECVSANAAWAGDVVHVAELDWYEIKSINSDIELRRVLQVQAFTCHK
jgi:hypothetical protein